MVVSQMMYAIVSATAWHEPRVSAKAANNMASDIRGSGLSRFRASWLCRFNGFVFHVCDRHMHGRNALALVKAPVRQ
jgi:hypothetical protein